MERSEAAIRHVRDVFGDTPKVVDTAGELAALAAALPPETALVLEETVRIGGPGQPGDGWVPAVVATIVTMTERPVTPVRGRQGRERDVLAPGLQLGRWVLPGPDAPVPAESRAYGYYDRMIEALEGEGPAESLPAAAALEHIAALLGDDAGGPGAFLLSGSAVAAQITGQAQRLRDVAAALAALVPLAAAEEAQADADPGDDAAEQNSDPPGSAMDSAQTPGPTAPGSGSPGGSGSPSAGGRASGEDLAGLVKVTIWLYREGNAENHAECGREPRPGARLLIRQEVVTARDEADRAEIGSIRAGYDHADDGKDRAEALRAATAGYFAKQVEDKLDISWWESRESFSLSDAAGALNDSADGMSSLVEGPLTSAAHAAGAADPAAFIFAGITANLATARLTAHLENAARTCEVIGVGLGLATGTQPLVVTCVKLLVRDGVDTILTRGIEQVLNPEPADHEPLDPEPADHPQGAAEVPGPSAPSEGSPDLSMDESVITSWYGGQAPTLAEPAPEREETTDLWAQRERAREDVVGPEV